MKITREWLEGHDACRSQVDIFAAEWPDGVEITEESLNRAVALSLNLDWLAERVLTAPAWAAYRAATATAFWAAFSAQGGGR